MNALFKQYDRHSLFSVQMSLPADEEGMMMLSSSPYPSTVHEWTKAIRRPTSYRVGNARFHLKPKVVLYAALLSASVLLLLIMFMPKSSALVPLDSGIAGPPYDPTYPLTNPTRLINGGTMFRIGLITDLDEKSKSDEKKSTWLSYFKLGNLTLSEKHDAVRVSLSSQPKVLVSKIAAGDRGMELSELVIFNGKLYSVDDRTGIIYHVNLQDYRVIPWVILADGDGNASKGFKAEWATVKNRRLVVGGLGKEWTTATGDVVNLDPQWIKSVGASGDVEHKDWHENYNALRKKTGMLLPGYIIHESGVWSNIHKKWFFLPRRASKQRYDEVEDEKRASNLMFIADEDFRNVEVRKIGLINPTHGFSSFKFIPGTEDSVIVALKSEEDDGKVASYILAFDVYGKSLMKEMKIGDVKYEGIEFV